MLRKVNTLISRTIAKITLKKCGANFRIGHTSHIKGYKNIEIGDNFFAGPYLYLNTNTISSIQIGNDVMLGPDVKIISGNHLTNYIHGPMNQTPAKKKGDDQGITIESDVWVGTNAIILDGAFISEGVVVGAGSIVNKFIPPYCIAAGNPVRIIKPRFSERELTCLLQAKQSRLTTTEISESLQKHGITLP